MSPLPSLQTVTVDWEVTDGLPGSSADITESTGTLSFAPGATCAVIEAPEIQDRIAELNEGYTLVLSNPAYATLQDGQDSLSARGVITDDASAVTIEAQGAAVDEGNDVVLTLTRDGDATNELTVWLQVATGSLPQTVLFGLGVQPLDYDLPASHIPRIAVPMVRASPCGSQLEAR